MILNSSPIAPLAAIFGLYFFVRGIRRIKQYEWTIIEDKNGKESLFIPYRGISKSDREAFEAKLVEAVIALENKK